MQRNSRDYQFITMDLNTHIALMEELNNRLVHGDIVDVAIMPPAVSLVFAIKRRVQNQGKASDGSSMKPYSTTPIYASRSQFIKGGFNPQGKNNFEGLTIGDRLVPTARLKTTGVKSNKAKYDKYSPVKSNFQERKTMYLPQGYKQLRDVQGLRTDVTNMTYSGAMMNDFWLERQDNDTVVTGLTSQKSADKYNGNSAKRGAFLVATEEETKKYLAEVNFNLTRLTRNIIQGYGFEATIS